MSSDDERIKKLLGIKLLFEGPSDWTTREYIELIDEYFMERLPVMLNNVLEPYGLEASIIEDRNECSLGIEPCDENTFIVEIYMRGSNKPLYHVVYRRRIGENTYEFYMKRFLIA